MGFIIQTRYLSSRERQELIQLLEKDKVLGNDSRVGIFVYLKEEEFLKRYPNWVFLQKEKSQIIKRY